MRSGFIKVDRYHNCIELTLARDEAHNALNLQMMDEFLTHLTHAKEESLCRGLIVKAIGPTFCAGGDLKEMVSDPYLFADKLLTLLNTLNEFPKPTAAYIDGPAYGGGVGLICCFDHVIASREASFYLSELALGLIPILISPFLLQKLGPHLTRQLALSPEPWTVQVAFHNHLVSKIIPANQSRGEISKFTEHFNIIGPLATQAIKQELLLQGKQTRRDNKKLIEQFVAIVQSPEAREGIEAFFDKRPTNWQGKKP